MKFYIRKRKYSFLNFIHGCTYDIQNKWQKDKNGIPVVYCTFEHRNLAGNGWGDENFSLLSFGVEGTTYKVEYQNVEFLEKVIRKVLAAWLNIPEEEITFNKPFSECLDYE